MARDHARLRLAIWSDDDFRQLPGDAQHLYWMLLTHPHLSYCGVVDWRPPRLSGWVGDWTTETVLAAADVLIERLYILVDEHTEEVLVRSFVRNDELMKQPKMATAMSTAHAAVGSVALRGVIVGEIQRLHREQPDLKGWGSAKASALLAKPSVDPSTYPCGKGSGKGSGNPSTKGSGNPLSNPSGKGSTNGSPTPCSLLPTPSSSTPSTSTAPPASRGRRMPDDFVLTEEMRAWATEHNFAQLDLELVTSEFVDYWRGVPGSKGSKTDWVATWRNRVREVAKRPTARAGTARRDGLKDWEL